MIIVTITILCSELSQGYSSSLPIVSAYSAPGEAQRRIILIKKKEGGLDI